MKWCGILFILLFFFNLSLIQGQSEEEMSDLWEKLSWRCVGPAAMGGRTVDIDVVKEKPWIIYAAIGPSGVWKSENDGTTWEPVFHKENTVSVGDIAVSPSHPEIVWVGTGEATCRNSVTIGDGIYKSIDGGKTWQNRGLEETRHISRIVVNPGDPNIVYVAAMGHLWGPNPERGIYKTLDGGKTWKKIFYVDENTGIADLVMDQSDSLTLYASSYEHRRLPYYFSSGGPGSGIYKTTDGGMTWEELTKDLPKGIKGRIGIDVSQSHPQVVYALIEHEDGGIWRSEDKGKTWERKCDNETYERVNFRPFYYSQIRVDPNNPNVVYVFSGGSYRSSDGGETFKPISQGTHSDHHALWIDPSNSLHLIDGNDGGIDITYDGGKNWRPIQHMTLAEVYQVGFDTANPYRVYCGLQDNGVWGGPSATLDTGGITNGDWIKVGGGDGFFCEVDPVEPHIVYANSQMNGLYRYNLKLRRSQSIKPVAPLREPPYRFNWNSPVHISPHNPQIIYTGGNYLFRSLNRGHSWEIISPDLSTNDPQKQKDSGGPVTLDNTGAEIHCTITTISESSVKKGVVWCGTDDGNVQVTKDGGKTWNNVVKNIPHLPSHTWCSRVEASHFDAGKAYAAFDGHREDDYRPYVYKTEDYGKTWTSIKGNLPFGWVHVIREDLKNPNLLFVGSEFGIFASLDNGQNWFSMKNDLPTAAVRDIAIHPREHDLIIGTHGRGIWIMEDISPLQEMTEEVRQSDFHLFSPHPVTQFWLSSSRESFSPPVYAAKNPPYGMILNAYLKEKAKERPQIFIKDSRGKTVFEIRLSVKKGLQRHVWNLRHVPETEEGIKVVPSATGFSLLPFVYPGEYTVEMKVGEETMVKRGTINPDSRFSFSKHAWESQIQAQSRVIVLSKKMGLAVTSVKKIRRELKKLDEVLKEKEKVSSEVNSALEDFENPFQNLEERIIPKGIGYRKSMEVALRGGSLSQQVMFLGMSVGGYPSAPTETELFQLQDLEERVNKLVEELNELIEKDISSLNQILRDHDLKTLRIPKKVSL